MSYKIGVHDYEVRRKAAVKFLEAGDKVSALRTHGAAGWGLWVRIGWAVG